MKEIPFSSLLRSSTFNCFSFFTFQSSHISISISIFLSKRKKKNKNRFDCNYSKELKIGKRVLLIFFYARRTNYNSIFRLLEEKRAYPTDDRKIDIKTLLRVVYEFYLLIRDIARWRDTSWYDFFVSHVEKLWMKFRVNTSSINSLVSSLRHAFLDFIGSIGTR